MMDDILAREKYQNFEGKDTLCLACNRTFNLLVSHCPRDSTQLIRIGQDENAENSSTTPKSAGSITLETGCIFDGRYEILAKAGEGGMGTVYAARNVDTGAQVAIKLLNAELLGDNDDQARFRREGNILAELKHPNIVKFYEYGVFQNVLPYLVLEWLEAKSLRTLINNGPILPNKVIEIGLQVCDALQCVHNAGIVHRDLKPNNILIADSDGSAKLLDFGLSRILNESPLVLTRHLTRTGLLIGSVHYMSPEQCIGKKVDSRADIYALGCVMYEMLTATQPFAADNPIALLSKHVTESEQTLARVTSAPLPDGLSECISRAMAKDIQDRYQTADEFAEDLRLIQAGNGGAIRGPKPAPVVTAGQSGRHTGTATLHETTIVVVGSLVGGSVISLLLINIWLSLWSHHKEPLAPIDAKGQAYYKDVDNLHRAEKLAERNTSR